MALARFLVDTSAIARYANPKVAARLDDLAMGAQAVTCGVVELQLLGAVLDVATGSRVDPHYDVIGQVTGQAVEWVVASSGQLGA